MSTYEQFLATKNLGSAVASTAPAVVIAGKDGSGNAAPFAISADGVAVYDAQAAAKLEAIKGFVDGLEALIGTLTTAVNTVDGHVDGVEGLIGASNTLLTAIQGFVDGVETLLAAPTPAGTNEIGKTNIKHFNIPATGAGILTRPANTTAYAANDSVSDNATIGSVTALPVTISDVNDDPVNVLEVLLDTNDTGFGNVSVRVHVFTSDPTASSGVQGGDNAAWSQKRSGWAGSFSGTMTLFNDGARGVLTPDGPSVKLMNVESGGRRLWWQLQVLGVATPSANSTIFTPRFKGYQGRS
jgi:hypothetical protein